MKNETTKFNYIDLFDFCSIQYAGPKQWVWQDQVPKDEVSLMFGAPGAGKSALALCLGLHVACGELTFLKEKIGEPGRNVLWMDSEMDKDIFKYRGSLMENALGKKVPPGALLYCRVKDYLGTNTACGKEVAQIVKTEKPYLVVVDSFSFAFQSHSENDINAAINAIRWLKELETTVVMIDHQAKNPKTNTPYGSVFKVAGARSLLQVSADSDGDVLLTQTKSNFGPNDREMRLRFDKDTMMFSLLTGWNAIKAAKPSAKESIVDELAQGAKTLPQLCEKIADQKPSSVKKRVGELLKAGAIIEVEGEKNTYALAA